MLLNLDIGFLPKFLFLLILLFVVFSRSLFSGRFRELCDEAWHYLFQIVVRFCHFFLLKYLFLLSLHFVDN